MLARRVRSTWTRGPRGKSSNRIAASGQASSGTGRAGNESPQRTTPFGSVAVRMAAATPSMRGRGGRWMVRRCGFRVGKVGKGVDLLWIRGTRRPRGLQPAASRRLPIFPAWPHFSLLVLAVAEDKPPPRSPQSSNQVPPNPPDRRKHAPHRSKPRHGFQPVPPLAAGRSHPPRRPHRVRAAPWPDTRRNWPRCNGAGVVLTVSRAPSPRARSVASCFGVYSLSRQLRSNPDVTVSPNTRGQSPEGRNFGSNQTTFNEKRVSRGRKVRGGTRRAAAAAHTARGLQAPCSVCPIPHTGNTRPIHCWPRPSPHSPSPAPASVRARRPRPGLCAHGRRQHAVDQEPARRLRALRVQRVMLIGGELHDACRALAARTPVGARVHAGVGRRRPVAFHVHPCPIPPHEA